MSLLPLVEYGSSDDDGEEDGVSNDEAVQATSGVSVVGASSSTLLSSAVASSSAILPGGMMSAAVPSLVGATSVVGLSAGPSLPATGSGVVGYPEPEDVIGGVVNDGAGSSSSSSGSGGVFVDGAIGGEHRVGGDSFSASASDDDGVVAAYPDTSWQYQGVGGFGGGSGAGGAGQVNNTTITLDADTSYTITVGSGGLLDTFNGTDGAKSSFVSTNLNVEALGGWDGDKREERERANVSLNAFRPQLEGLECGYA